MANRNWTTKMSVHDGKLYSEEKKCKSKINWLSIHTQEEFHWLNIFLLMCFFILRVYHPNERLNELVLQFLFVHNPLNYPLSSQNGECIHHSPYRLPGETNKNLWFIYYIIFPTADFLTIIAADELIQIIATWSLFKRELWENYLRQIFKFRSSKPVRVRLNRWLL